MGIINNRRPTFVAADSLETPVHRVECRKHTEHFRLVEAEAHRRAVDTEQVRHIESPYQWHEHFLPVHIEQHTVETLLQNLRMVVCEGARRVGVYVCAAVLRHHKSVFVVLVGNRKSRLFESVEQAFFGVAIVVEGLMIVDMVAGEVGEQCPVEIQSRDTFLRNGMTADFHKRVFATGVHHTPKQSVQFDSIGGGVCGGNGFVLYIVHHRREQTCFVSQSAHQVIE